MIDRRFVELRIPAESQFVAQARRFIADAAQATGWMDQQRLDDLRLVASETVTNALRAHWDAGATSSICVRCEAFNDRFEFSVIDEAGGFTLPDRLDIAADEKLQREGGYGLPLIEALSDEAHFLDNGVGTTVRLVLYRMHSARGARSA